MKVKEVDEIGYETEVGDERTSLKRISKMERRELVYSKKDCVGCGMCYEACPLSAIEFGPSGATAREIIEPPSIVIDPEKCVHCGICAGVCMFNVLDLLVNGKSIKEDDKFVKYEKVFNFVQEKCKFKDEDTMTLCQDCEVACPTEAIKCKIVEKGRGSRNTIDFEEGLCIYCKACEKACPEDAIMVEKFYDGDINVDLDKCDGCGVCVEICPANAISMPKPEIGERVDKIVIDKDTCIYCKACEKACPTDALEVKRTGVKIKNEKRAPWTKTWEKTFNKLASEKVDKNEL